MAGRYRSGRHYARASYVAGRLRRAQSAAEGKEHDLWVKVLALEDASGSRAVLITSDLLGYSRVMFESIGRRSKSTAVSTRRRSCSPRRIHTVALSCASRCGLLPARRCADGLVETYSQKLEQQITEAVSAALKDLKPATLEARRGTAAFAVNRRTNREPEVADRLAAENCSPALSIMTYLY